MNEQIKKYIAELTIEFLQDQAKDTQRKSEMARQGMLDLFPFELQTSFYSKWRMQVRKYMVENFNDDEIGELVQALEKIAIQDQDYRRIIGLLEFWADQPVGKTRQKAETKNHGSIKSQSPITVNVSAQGGNATATASAVNINVIFDNARHVIENSESLNDEQTAEAMEVLSKIKEIIEAKESKKSKWGKLRQFIIWVADKASDVGVAILSAIALGMGGGI